MVFTYVPAYSVGTFIFDILRIHGYSLKYPPHRLYGNMCSGIIFRLYFQHDFLKILPQVTLPFNLLRHTKDCLVV